MTITTLALSCRDPIVSRDGRPFGAGQGNRMRSVGWPFPSVVAGSLRTAIGKAAEREFSLATAQELLQVVVAGVFPVADGQMYLPAPNDYVIEEKVSSGKKEQMIHRAKPLPLKPGEGCDWPAAGLRPVMLSEEQAKNDFKPKDGPAWWPVDRYADWLTGRAVSFGPTFMNAPAREDRTHVQLDADTGAADEGNLFTTAALPLSHLNRYGVKHDVPFRERFAEIILTTRLNASAWCGEAAAQMNILHPLGGERRLVHWRAVDLRDLWECPETVSAKLSGAKQVRMVLATPAIFRDDEMKHGWKPGWLNDDLEGSPPNAANVTLKLVGVATQRWRAVSGWSLADLPNQPRGPKPVKRMVPAGGVYFFEVIRGQAEDLNSLWLEPISDDMQDRRDGFGLAVWGTW